MIADRSGPTQDLIQVPIERVSNQIHTFFTFINYQLNYTIIYYFQKCSFTINLSGTTIRSALVVLYFKQSFWPIFFVSFDTEYRISK